MSFAGNPCHVWRQTIAVLELKRKSRELGTKKKGKERKKMVDYLSNALSLGGKNDWC